MIFLGAGASTIFGLKTLQGLTDDLVNKMAKAGHEEIILDIQKGLKRFGRVPDFENVYTILEALVDPEQGIRDSGPFAAYIAHVCKDFRNVTPHPKFKDILEDFRRFIFEECTITAETIEDKARVYRNLFSMLDSWHDDRLLSSTIGAGGEQVEIPASRTVATTNYDMSVELYHARAEQSIADGFSAKGDDYIKELDPLEFRRPGNQTKWLLKLHGSIWQFHHNGKFCKALFDPEQLPHRRLKIKERMMIYPVGEKPILREPYYTFYKIFKEQPWRLMVAIGHSFRDLPINVAVLENLRNRSRSKLIILDRSPDEAFKNLGVGNRKLSKRIIRVEGDFGDPQIFKKLQLALQSKTFRRYKSNVARAK